MTAGKLAWQLATGRNWKKPLVPYGEQVFYLPRPRKDKDGKKRLAKLEEKWKEGKVCGIRDDTGEYIVLTEDGAVSASSLRRKPPGQRWTTHNLHKLKGTPWEPDPKEPGQIRVKSATVVEEDLTQPLAAATEAVTQVRAFQIRKNVELDKFGFTAGCEGCKAARLGTTQRPHSDACRERITKEMMKDGLLK